MAVVLLWLFLGLLSLLLTFRLNGKLFFAGLKGLFGVFLQQMMKLLADLASFCGLRKISLQEPDKFLQIHLSL